MTQSYEAIDFAGIFSYSDGIILRVSSSILIDMNNPEKSHFKECEYRYITCLLGSHILSNYGDYITEVLVSAKSGNYNVRDDTTVTKINEGILPLEGRYEIPGIESCVSYRPVIYKKIVGFLILDTNGTLSLKSVEETGYYDSLDDITFEGVIDYSEMLITRVHDERIRIRYFAELLVYKIADDGNSELLHVTYKCDSQGKLSVKSRKVIKTKGELKFSCCYRDNKLNKNARNV